MSGNFQCSVTWWEETGVMFFSWFLCTCYWCFCSFHNKNVSFSPQDLWNKQTNRNEYLRLDTPCESALIRQSSMTIDCGQWGRTGYGGRVFLPGLKRKWRCLDHLSELPFWAFPHALRLRGPVSAFWALTALFLAFQRNELWILNDFVPPSLAALPQGVSTEIFNSFACQRLVTIYISGVFWKPVASCLSALQPKSLSWAEINTETGFSVGLIYEKNLAKKAWVLTMQLLAGHLNAAEDRKEDYVKSTNPKPVSQDHLMNPEAAIYCRWNFEMWEPVLTPSPRQRSAPTDHMSHQWGREGD